MLIDILKISLPRWDFLFNSQFHARFDIDIGTAVSIYVEWACGLYTIPVAANNPFHYRQCCRESRWERSFLHSKGKIIKFSSISHENSFDFSASICTNLCSTYSISSFSILAASFVVVSFNSQHEIILAHKLPAYVGECLCAEIRLSKETYVIQYVEQKTSFTHISDDYLILISLNWLPGCLKVTSTHRNFTCLSNDLLLKVERKGGRRRRRRRKASSDISCMIKVPKGCKILLCS